ncbi:MAG: DUF3526 domain-containing protein [Gemmatimonadetes bacterium]|nr:DUF3526 domain-containing protein [Gemmatimonadota bacterium]
MPSAPTASGARLIVRVAQQELRHAWRTRSTLLLGGILTALLLLAAITAHDRQLHEAAQRQRYQDLVGSQFASQPDRHPHRVSHYGYLLFRPVAPLSAFDSGVERFAGTSIFLEAHRQNTANFSAASQAGTERFGDLTPASVLQLFVPLFLLVTAGVSITREREAGTLALHLAQGVSWRALVAGKVSGIFLLVLLVTTPGLLATTWVVTRTQPLSEVAPRLLILAALHAVFWAAVATAATLVSARTRTSREALAITLGTWIALWILVPRLAPVAANAGFPLPSRAEFAERVEASVRALGDAHDPDDPAFARLRQETLAKHGVATVAELPFNYQGLVMQEGERHTAEAFQAHLDSLDAVRERQQMVLDLFGIASPLLATRSLSMATAGTDPAHLAEFERQAEAYRYDLIQRLNTLHMEQVASAQDRYGDVVNGAPSRQRIDQQFFASLPAFAWQAPSLGTMLARRARAGGVLLLVVTLVAIAFVRTTHPRGRRA